MAIIKRTTYWGERAGEETHEPEYPGRVIEIRKYTDRRNMSDTLDYTDWRTVECTDALVWLGEVGRPNGSYWVEPRPLEFHEQFKWLDCSNHFADRMHFTLHPEVDAHPGSGEPIMWANLIAWRSHQEGLKREAEAERRAAHERQVLHEQKIAEDKLRREKEMAEGKANAESLLRIWAPSKGSEVTLEGLTGTVFWTGVKHYRGAWRSTVGVKDKYGTAHWVDISKFMPPVEKKVRSRKEKNQK
jgi:hypothetical protein